MYTRVHNGMVSRVSPSFSRIDPPGSSWRVIVAKRVHPSGASRLGSTRGRSIEDIGPGGDELVFKVQVMSLEHSAKGH